MNIVSVAYTSAGSHVAITMDDGTVWHDDTTLSPDNEIRRKLADWIEAGGKIAPFTPVPPMPLTRLSKADLWRRITDDEAEALHTALQAAPLRLRMIFEAAQYLDTADADYPALRSGITAGLGAARADEVLEPNY